MKTNHYIPNHTLTKTDQGYVVNFIVEQNKLIPVFENMSLEQACQAMLIQEQILLQPTDILLAREPIVFSSIPLAN